MKIAILGFADQGKSAYEYWNKPENQLTICDKDESLELPEGASAQLGAGYLKGLDRFDLLVRTPSLHPKDIVAANNPTILSKVTTNTNEFFKVCPTRNIIGVTGTKGKGTTATLITKILERAGKKVHLGGNIGTPPLEMLKAGIGPEDYVVLELANFQLIDINHSPHIGVCLMVAPEHLDWHGDVNEYVTAKQRMFAHQKPDDIAIFCGQNELSEKVVSVSPGKKIPYMHSAGAEVKNDQIVIDGQTICNVNELKLLGKHNWQNACAAVTAVWQAVKDVQAIRSVLTTFTGLEHRLELVREVGGVKYYDDSFGTTPETAIVAIEAFAQPKVVILGGSSKGASYDELAKTVRSNNVKSVVIIGDEGPKIADILEQKGFKNIVAGGKTMGEIVATAKAQAETGDIVLLSTACASFDMFANYKDRGEQFKAAVSTLS